MIEFIQHKNLKWYHILNPSDEDFKYLMDNFPFHPLDIEDCRSKSQRPKVDIYDDYYFIILHFPYFDKVNKFLKTKEIKIFWGKDYIITVGNSHWVVKNLFNTAEKNPMLKEELLSGTSDILLYKILERLMSESQILLNKISNEVELINLYLFNKNAEKTIERISVSRRNLILLNTIFKPQLRVFHKFESGDVKGYADDMEEYWGNILDYYQKIWDMIEDYEELIEGLSKTFDSLQANKTNEIMKVLTFISTTLLPLTFLTGLYGMNIGLPLQNHPYSFYFLIGIMIAIVLFLVLYFRKRKWI
jgi:magnesium transporter